MARWIDDFAVEEVDTPTLLERQPAGGIGGLVPGGTYTLTATHLTNLAGNPAAAGATFTHLNTTDQMLLLAFQAPTDTQPEAQSAYGLTTLFQGRTWHADLGMYYYRARWYLPEMGEFAERDPIEHVDSSGPYYFVANGPVNRIDPRGNRIVILLYGLGSAFDNYDGMTQLAQKLVSRAKSRGQEYRLVEVVDYEQGALVELEKSPGYRDTWDDLQIYVVDQVSGDATPAKEAVVREITEATDGTEEVFLVGHSLGAVRSLQLARQLGRIGRRVQGLVATDQFGRLLPSSNNGPRNVDRFLAFYSDPTREIIKRRRRDDKPHLPGSGKRSFDLCRGNRNYGIFAVNETHQSIDNSDLVQDLIIEFLDGIPPVVPGRDEERQRLMRDSVPWPSEGR